jgi:formyl-CoA transferase
VKEALESRQTESRGMVIQREGPNQKPLQFLGSPIALSDYHPSIRSLPPAFGEHTHSVLKELGFSDSDILEFEKEGVI